MVVCGCDCLLDVFHTPIISYISAFCQGRRHRIGGQFLILSKFFCDVSHCHIRTYGRSGSSTAPAQRVSPRPRRGCPQQHLEESGAISPVLTRVLEGGVFQSHVLPSRKRTISQGGSNEINSPRLKCPLLYFNNYHVVSVYRFLYHFSFQFPSFVSFCEQPPVLQVVRCAGSILLLALYPSGCQHFREYTGDLFPTIFCS